jgi:hypothetical protein
MTPREWNNLPELIRRGDVLAAGLTRDVLPVVTVLVASAGDLDAVPHGKVAAVRVKTAALREIHGEPDAAEGV